MKNRYQVLKQIRIYFRYSIEELSRELHLSETYIGSLENGNVQNIEYLYDRYAKLARMSASALKKLVRDAERDNYDIQTIVSAIGKATKQVK